MLAGGKRTFVMSGSNRFLLDSNIIIRLSKQDNMLSEWFNNNEDFAISIITNIWKYWDINLMISKKNAL